MSRVNSSGQLSGADVKTFQSIVWKFYHQNKRTFPWRSHRSPYRILVSEMMLQQTQANRTVEKFQQFIRQFSSLKQLSEATQKEVLAAWQGLGYNRRALFLHRTAKAIRTDHGGRVPKDPAVLESLPGIGPYTASAIAVFAYDQPYALIETNVRTVFFNHFFGADDRISDGELLEYAKVVLDQKNPCEWNWALMDYGSHLKKEGRGRNKQSRSYTKQSPFSGSTREVRGSILRHLIGAGLTTHHDLYRELDFSKRAIQVQLKALQKEGFITETDEGISLR